MFTSILDIYKFRLRLKRIYTINVGVGITITQKEGFYKKITAV